MNKVAIVFRHEFLQKVRSKWYRVTTLLGPVFLAALFILPSLLAQSAGSDEKRVVVVDSTGSLAGFLLQDSSTAGLPGSSQIRYELALSGVTVDTLKAQVRRGDRTAMLLIPATALSNSDSSNAKLFLENSNDRSVISQVEKRFRDAVLHSKLAAAGVDPALPATVLERTEIQTVKVSDESENADSGLTFAISFIMAFFIYILLLIYGTTIMRSVIEEKSSRVIEIIVSSIEPYELLLGKVLGVGLAAVLQMGVWVLMLALLGTIGLTFASNLFGDSLTLGFPVWYFIWPVVYFLFGFFIYATLYAALGSMADQESDLQQISLPVTLLVVIPFVMLTGVIQSPNAPTNVIMSMIPLFSPILMIGRIFSQTPPWWQIALSIVLMLGTGLLILRLGGKIYKIGVLMYGKKVSFKEIAKWLRYS